jgi:hypothetical protein
MLAFVGLMSVDVVVAMANYNEQENENLERLTGFKLFVEKAS